MNNIRRAIDWVVGGYYNDLQDGNEERLPGSKEQLANIIYDSAMFNYYGRGYEAIGKAPREMRFAGEKFCRAYIDWKLDQDHEVAEIAQAANW